MLISEGDQRDVLVYAVRYTLGRSTYSTSTMQSVLVCAWPELTKPERAFYKKEIREARSLGDEKIDAPGWKAILDLED